MEKKKHLFDYCIGNPPYNEDFDNSGENGNYAKPVYNIFMDATYKVAEKVELIHPARFLFNAGSTPKVWNEKMLHDEHFEVLRYEENSAVFFPSLATPIKGGIAISYRDDKKTVGAIGIFTKYAELNTILKKTGPVDEDHSLMSIVYIQNRFDLDALYKDHSDYKPYIGSDGKDPRFEKNIFVKIPAFTEDKSSESDIRTLGIFQQKREWRYILEKYVDKNHQNLSKYKVVLSVANGNGEFGQTLGTPVILKINEAYTRSFIGIGAFDKEEDAEALLKYLKSKFARAMLSILKVTQMTNKDVWRYVPLQDFSPSSDIDWSKSIHEIGLQLYRKYGLDASEIDFIENNVKEMK